MATPSRTIIDSHIHLWPASASNSAGHAWMEEGFILTKPHLLSGYYKAAKQNEGDHADYKVRGLVYLETDRRLGDPKTQPLEKWAAQPIEEIKFVRQMVEGAYGQRDSDMLLGLVPWAPMNQGRDVFEEWLALAERTAGPATWARVKGFRFLLQGITDQKAFESLVFSDDFVAILKSFHDDTRDFSFDVGVDQHSGGVWQLQAFAKVLERVHGDVGETKKTSFVLNHLCKPDMTVDATRVQSSEDFRRWSACIERLASFSNVYMKLSGGFSELSNDRVETSSVDDLVSRMKPWLDQVFSTFTPDKIMFGSDWPVCNVRGPKTEDSWTIWKDCVQTYMTQRGLSDSEQQKIWSGNVVKAYKLDV